MNIIEASRDQKSLEKYVPLFIEKAASDTSDLRFRRDALRRAAAINPARLQTRCSLFAIPYAFELWIAHLASLDRLAHAVVFTLDDLTADEARGLALLRHHREQFWRTHIACPHCRSVNMCGASFCGSCGADFSEART